MKKQFVWMGAMALVMGGCATKPRFEYGNYEPTLYSFYKKPDQADKFADALEKAIEKGLQEDRLAPGLHAELGYLRLSQGDEAEALSLFAKEAQYFPESAYFMERISSNLTGGATDPESPDGASDTMVSDS